MAAACVLASTQAGFSQGLDLPRTDERYYVFNEASIRLAARTMGYMIGQRATLEEIVSAYPSMTEEAQQLQKSFDAGFNFPEIRSRRFLEDAIGEENAGQHAEKLEIQSRVSVRGVGPDVAREFLGEVRERIGGTMSEPELKAMLWLQYATHPADEMREWTQQFSSIGHPKSMGLNIELKAPLSWNQAEGDRPHVLAKWTSQGGTGDMVITLIVNDLGEVISKADVEATAQADDFGWLLASGATFVDGAYVEVDRQPGLMVDSLLKRRSLDVVSSMDSRTISLFVGHKLVQLGCLIYRAEDYPASFLEKRARGLRDVCAQMARTMVFPATW